MVYFRFVNRRILVLCRKHTYFCTVLFSVICFVSYTEIISYSINTNTWFHLKCLNTADCIKILLVADPQITGHEQLNILSPLAQYDCDSYLKKTYLHALNFVKPDLIIFLGDLMDEGSTATNEEYDEYLRRFLKIFSKPDGQKKIWLPGDNDIGGEGSDRVNSRKVERFTRAFNQEDVINFGNIKLLKVNQLTHSFPKIDQKRNFYNTSQIFVVLSHMPLMFMPSLFVEKVLSNIQPHLIFAAHQHQAMIVSTDGLLRQDRHIVPLNPKNNKVFNFKLGSNDMYEILVPTCSYRMGTTKIGYGYAVIDKDELKYSVLWSPSRFHQLWNYILMLILIFISSFLVKYYQ